MRPLRLLPVALLLSLFALARGGAQEGGPSPVFGLLLRYGEAVGQTMRGEGFEAAVRACAGPLPTLERLVSAAQALAIPVEPAEVSLAELRTLQGPVMAMEKDPPGWALYLARSAEIVQRQDSQHLHAVPWETIAARYAGKLLRMPQGHPRTAILDAQDFHASLEAPALGATVEHAYYLRNAGTTPLTVRFLRSSCECATAFSNQGPIPPGGRMLLRVTVRARTVGSTTGGILLSTDDPLWPRITLTIEVRVAQRVTVEPADLVILLDQQDGRFVETTLAAPGGTALVGVESTAPWLDVSLSREVTSPNRREWGLQASVRGDGPGEFGRGFLLAELALPERTHVRIPVTARWSDSEPPAVAPPDARRPAIRLLYTGDTDGFFGPCDCVAGQLGGLARMGTLVGRLREEADGCLLLDGGGAVDRMEKAPDMAEAYWLLGYAAAGLSRGDLSPTGQPWRDALRERRVPATTVTGEHGLPRHLTLSTPRGSVAVVSLPEPGDNADRDREQSLTAIREAAATTPAALAVLSRRGPVADVGLARELATSPVPVAIFGLARHVGLDEPIRMGPVVLAPIGDRGMHLACVDLVVEGGRLAIGSSRRLPVGPESAERADVALVVQRYFEEQRRRLQAAPPAAVLEPPLPPSACADCHPAETADWAASRHSRALRTLAAKNRLVRECIECHSESFRRTGVLPSGAAESPDEGVTCATCHRREREHAADPERVRTVAAVTSADCRACHTEQQQIGFDYARSLASVRHARPNKEEKPK